jgi:hypothetical protein
MKLNGKIFGLVLAGLVLLPGCIGIRNYQPRPLRVFENNNLYHKITKDGITLRVKQLTSQEKNYCFDGHAVPLDGIKAVYLSISNVSDRSYIITPGGINLLQISLRDIKKSIRKTDTFAYFSGALITGLILVNPIALAMCYIACVPAFIAAAILPFEGMFLAKMGRSAVMNHRIDKDLREKILHKKVFIKSGNTYEGLIFVKSEDYNPQFSITVQEKNNRHNTIIFDVDLLQSSNTHEV